MPTPRDPATVERARVLVETTVRTLEGIALEVGVSVQTLRTWSAKHGWRRPAQAPRAVPKLPPEKEEPARRVFENRAGAGDLAVLLGCDQSYVWRLAKSRGWERGAGRSGEPSGEPGDEIKAIEAALRDPACGRADFLRLAERATMLLATEALVSGDARLDRRIGQLAKLVDLARRWPGMDAAPAPAPEDMSDEEFGEICDELAIAFERWRERSHPPLPDATAP